MSDKEGLGKDESFVLGFALGFSLGIFLTVYAIFAFSPAILGV